MRRLLVLKFILRYKSKQTTHCEQAQHIITVSVLLSNKLISFLHKKSIS